MSYLMIAGLVMGISVDLLGVFVSLKGLTGNVEMSFPVDWLEDCIGRAFGLPKSAGDRIVPSGYLSKDVFPSSSVCLITPSGNTSTVPSKSDKSLLREGS